MRRLCGVTRELTRFEGQRIYRDTFDREREKERQKRGKRRRKKAGRNNSRDTLSRFSQEPFTVRIGSSIVSRVILFLLRAQTARATAVATPAGGWRKTRRINSIVPPVGFLREAGAPAKFRAESFLFPPATKAFLALFSPGHAGTSHPPTADQAGQI